MLLKETGCFIFIIEDWLYLHRRISIPNKLKQMFKKFLMWLKKIFPSLERRKESWIMLISHPKFPDSSGNSHVPTFPW